MASATLYTLCTALAAHCSLTHKNRDSPFSQNSNLGFFSLLPSFPSQKLSFQPIFSPRSPFLFLPKSSQSEAPVIESEPEATPPLPEPGASELEAAEIVKASPEQPPKREQVFAVVMIGSRQYIVFPGRFIYTQRLKGANVNDKIALHKVLLVGTRTSTYIGKPIVTNAVVHATVEEQGLNPKVIVFKYKRKKHYRRNIGHRQPNTRIRINSITGYEDYPAVTLDSLNE